MQSKSMRKHGCSKERGARISHLDLICAADPYTTARGGRSIRECTPPARGMRASQLNARREKGALEREIAPRRRPLPHHPPSPPWPVVRRELSIAAARSWSQAKQIQNSNRTNRKKKINRGGQEGEGEMDAAQGGSTHLGL